MTNQRHVFTLTYMRSAFQTTVCSLRRITSILKHWQVNGASGHQLRIAASVGAACANVFMVIEGAPLLLLWVLTLFFLGPILLVAGFTKPRAVSLIHYIWRHPIYFLTTTTIAISILIFALSALHVQQVSANVTNPAAGQPWRQGLTAQVWWEKPPSKEMEYGLADTAQIFGFAYERVQSFHDANLRVWFDSWAYQCKWLTTYAFVSLDPNPSSCGGQTGDIYVCKFTASFADRRLSDYSLVAHEAAHIFAAQPHFGDGLMAEGGGKYASRFTDEEFKAMRTRVNAFNTSTGPECTDPPQTPAERRR